MAATQQRFLPEVQAWFDDVFAAPTAVQSGAWDSISRGEHTLIVAPTGSGKTLAAFLWAINSLVNRPGQLALPLPGRTAAHDAHSAAPADDPEHREGVRVLYISPLKALGVDVERNLRAPLTGISLTAEKMGNPSVDIRVGVRSGDTSSAERQRQIVNPPDILITTPESLYLMLTSKAAAVLRSVDTVIIDEIHAVAGSKRGVHLALSLERLEEVCEQPPQRIGLSATVRPLERVAQFLGGDRPVSIVNPGAEKHWELAVHSAVPNMSDLPTPEKASRIGEILVDDLAGITAPLDVVRQSIIPGPVPVGTDALAGDNDPFALSPVSFDDDDTAANASNAGEVDADAVSETSGTLPGRGTLPGHSASGHPVVGAHPMTGEDPMVGGHPMAGEGPMVGEDPGALWGAPGPVDFSASAAHDASAASDANATGTPEGAGAAGADAVDLSAAFDGTTATEGSIWPFIEQSVYTEIMESTSTLVFVNSRRQAERLTARINELYAAEYAPEELSPALRRPPALLGKVGDVAGSARTLIARAHHGSVAKEERARTEHLLKAGELRAVVATSSLELGIDMGAVDKVIQVQSPPSVASGLQRVGRAGHSVGATSVGSFYPLHRSDLVSTCVIVERMRAGQIEELTIPHNALDVLAQHTVAMVVHADIHVDNWYEIVRRAMPYRGLGRDVFDAVIDLVSGEYPSTDFSELRPRVVYDRVTGMLSARPGAQRLAVTSGGTIPDRGLFGVFLVGSAAESAAPRRVGELDEEMVYESRVGDVFTLGASSWRIEEITRDQVLVSPAPGHTGRLPFWSGDQAGRPYELGRAIGAFRRRVAEDPTAWDAAAGDAGDVEPWARDNVVAYLEEQKQACGLVPDERTLLVECFRDELGDWRVVLHTPFGHAVNAAWALAVGHRISRDSGIDAQAVAGDDGIVLRLPDGEHEPGPELFTFEADDIREIVTQSVGESALFASRFRECAARALLLPRRNPGRRAPLWQQRQRAAQLLDVAKKYPSFPIILETVRECLHDVYDLGALEEICRDIHAQRVRIAHVTVDSPTPFASSLLFNYTGAFMYQGDTPAAEKRAAALALDPALLAQLLGHTSLKDLLDPTAVADVTAEVRRTAPSRRAGTLEQLVDALQILGPIPVAEVGEYLTDDLRSHVSSPDGQVDASALLGAVRALPGRRVMVVRIAGREHLARTQDAPLLRDGLGIPTPPGVSADPTPVADAMTQLITRYSRTHGPFSTVEVAAAFGCGFAVAHNELQALESQGVVRSGQFTSDEQQWVDPQVLRMMRSRSLAKARAEAEPVSQSAYARFLVAWHEVAPVGAEPARSGVDGVFQTLEQLAGVRLPASAWE